MKRIGALIFLFFHVLFTGNFLDFVFLNSYTPSQIYAASNNWDFSNIADYTLSDTASLNIQNGIGDLNLTLIQTGSLADNGTNVFLDGARRVSIKGNHAFISTYRQDRVQIIDISDPSNPTAVSNIVNNGTSFMLDGPMESIVHGDGNYLYVAEYAGDAIQIIDITDPLVPLAAGNYVNNGSVRLNGPRGLAIQGNYLYVTSYIDDALQVFDISIPTTLTPVGNLRNTTRLNGARDIIVEGDYAYISSRNADRIQVIDISSPANPLFVGEIVNNDSNIFLDSVWGIEKLGDYIFTASYNQDRIQIIDVSTPSTPTAVANISTADASNLNGPRELFINEDFLYIANYIGDSIIIFDISTPTNPIFESEIQNTASTNLNGPIDLKKIGDYIYTTSYQDDDFVILEEKYTNSSPFITPNTAFNYTGEDIVSFIETAGAGNEGTLTYQISKDNGATWYYWNGNTWQITTNNVINSNSASIINTYISDFNTIVGGTNEFVWKAFLHSDGHQKVEIDAIDVRSVASGPGGVASNLQVWLKADAGTSTTTDGATLSTWNDQSGNNYDATAVTAPIYKNNSSDSLNFNPVIDFNGVSQYMQNLDDGAYTQSYFMVVIPDNTIDGTITGHVPFGFDCNSGTLSAGTCGLTFAGTVLGSFTTAIPDEVITHALGSSANWRSGQNGVASYSLGKPMLIAINENAGATNTDIYEKGVKVDSVNTNTYQTLSNADYTLGRSPDNTHPFYYDGKIAEVINYSSRLNDSERNQVESYLSLKYGITLNNGTQDYIASDGSTTMWSSSSAGAYKYNIVGIGRDDTTLLGQIKSKSVNDDAVLTIEALGEGTNSIPSFVDMNDKEFLSISHQHGSNAWSAVDSPASYNTLARRWKAQEVGDIGSIQLEFDVSNTNFDIPALNAGINYYFITDSNGDGKLNDETAQVMTNVSGDIWRTPNINLDTNEIFTIATQAGANNIPTDINISSSSIDENVANGGTVGTFSTVDADIGDSHSYSLVAGVGDDENSNFNIVGSSLIKKYSPDFEIKSNYSIRVETNDGSGGTYQEAFTISINNLAETISSIIDFEDLADEEKYTVTSGTWTRTTNNPQESLRSLESDNAGENNTQSCFEIQHNMVTAGNINFQYNVSSQADSDFLHFYIDNIEQQTWSGTVPWTLYSSPTLSTGVHDYKWCYIKDGGGSAGNDAAYIDYVSFPSITEPILSASKTDNDTDNTVLTNQIVRYTISISNTGIDASGITVSDVIDSNYLPPYNFTYNNCGIPAESFTAPTLNFTNISIVGGNTCEINYDVQVSSSASSGLNINNSADVSAALEGGNNPAIVNADTLTVLSCVQNNVSLIFETDGYGEDTFWSLVPNGNSCGVGEIANGGNTTSLTCNDGGSPATANAANPYGDNTIITEGPYALAVGSQYDIHVIDDYGDGISAADPDLRVNQNGTDSNTFNVTNNGGVFTFTVQEPTGCTDTVNPSVTINQASSQVDPTGADSARYKIAFDEPINVSTFNSSDISIAGTTGTITSGPTEIAPNNGTSFEIEITGMTLGDTVSATIGSGLIEDLAGNTNNASTSIDNQITYNISDAIAPSITLINHASGSLLPGGNHNIEINYNDAESGIDIASESLMLYKWNGTAWGSNIYSSGINDAGKVVSSTGALYPTNNLTYGKYRYDFTISDNSSNSSGTGAVFYIDEPEFIVSTGSIDIGGVNYFTHNFSDTVTLTIKTLGASFDVYLEKNNDLVQGLENIPSWNGTNGYGYDSVPYTGNVQEIILKQNIASQTKNININGDLNTYTYDIKIGALTDQYRTNGDYKGSINFGINLGY